MQVINVKNKPDGNFYISQLSNPISLTSQVGIWDNFYPVYTNWINVDLDMQLKFLDKTEPEPQAWDFLT